MDSDSSTSKRDKSPPKRSSRLDVQAAVAASLREKDEKIKRDEAEEKKAGKSEETGKKLIKKETPSKKEDLLKKPTPKSGLKKEKENSVDKSKKEKGAFAASPSDIRNIKKDPEDDGDIQHKNVSFHWR